MALDDAIEIARQQIILAFASFEAGDFTSANTRCVIAQIGALMAIAERLARIGDILEAQTPFPPR